MNASPVPASPVKRLGTLLGSLVVASAMIATPTHAATQNVTLSNFMFAPAMVTVAAGDSVTWGYNGMDGQTGLYGLPVGPRAPHNVHFMQDNSKLSGNADGSPLAAAWSKSRTFADAGTFRYYCDVHGAPDGSGMAGTVTVTGAAGAVTPMPQGGAPVLSGRVTGGTSLRLVLKSSEAATFKAVVQQRSKSTRRLRRIGTIRLRLQAGTNRLRVRTVAGKKLTAGRYRLVGRATDSDGQRSASLTRTFTIGS